MNCKQIQQQLRDCREVESLSDDARGHLAHCADCARAAGAARVEKHLLSVAARAEAPEPLRGFEQRVLDRIEQRRSQMAADSTLVLGRVAWRLIPALGIVIAALAVASVYPPKHEGANLASVASEGALREAGWGAELAQFVIADNMGGLR